ncbi:lysoplasmalogenase [Vibrio mimicus]|uniref:lysoplasmalogenase n=1 Tax=Vibrio mimicus TaxID=674 RepID=UPI002F94E5CA
MGMLSWISVVLSGFISISAYEDQKVKQAVFFRMFSLFLLIMIIWERHSHATPALVWISLGLAISMLAHGMRLNVRYHRASFVLFLVAQLFFSKAFWVQLSGAMVWWLPALLVAASIVAFFLLLPQIDTLIFPVTIMGLILVQMTWAAGELWLQDVTLASAAGFLGCLVYILSATLLAIHDYRRPLPLGHYLISTTYLAAQALISASLVL